MCILHSPLTQSHSVYCVNLVDFFALGSTKKPITCSKNLKLIFNYPPQRQMGLGNITYPLNFTRQYGISYNTSKVHF